MCFLGWGVSAIPTQAWSLPLLDGVSLKKPPALNSLPGNAVSQKPPFKVPIMTKTPSRKPPTQALNPLPGSGKALKEPLHQP